MADLSAFSVTRQFPPQHPDRLQLYSFPTPNGIKVTILLEELLEAGHDAEYDAWLIEIGKGDQFGSGFVGVNGVFRLLPDGTNQRGLAVATIRDNAVVILDPAPRSFAGSGS